MPSSVVCASQSCVYLWILWFALRVVFVLHGESFAMCVSPYIVWVWVMGGGRVCACT